MIVFHDRAHERHDPKEPHLFNGSLLPPAETAARADRILMGLAAAGLNDVRPPDPIEEPLLRAVHTEAYLDFLRTAHERWLAETGAPSDGEAAPYVRPREDTRWREPSSVLAQIGRFSFDVDPILAGTWEAARASAACAVAAARQVVSGDRAAYALCRPPGHHAGPGQFGGYCYLNNVAISAAWLAAAGHRVAVLDLDAHHGNGTQSIFWARGDVFTASIHGEPDHNYPFFTGYADERGDGDGEGANVNLPLASGAAWSTYSDALREVIRLVRERGSDVLVVALGVDTDTVDGVFGLFGWDFTGIGEMVGLADLPTVFVQEGGYGRGVLEHDVAAVLLGFLGSL